MTLAAHASPTTAVHDSREKLSTLSHTAGVSAASSAHSSGPASNSAPANQLNALRAGTAAVTSAPRLAADLKIASQTAATATTATSSAATTPEATITTERTTSPPGISVAASASDEAAGPKTLAATAEPLPPRVFCAEDDEQLSSLQLMAAGAMAGMTEHLAMYPIDTVKTRMQSYVALRDASNLNMLNTTRSILTTGGPAALWRGVSAVAISAGPAHAFYFATYERVRDALNRLFQSRRSQHLSSVTSSSSSSSSMITTSTNSTSSSSTAPPPPSLTAAVNPVATSLAGICATVACDGVMTPLDVVKQRMQLSSGAWYASAFACARHVYTNHGWRAFFAGYRATVLMNIPFTAVYFTGYEVAKHAILDWREIDETDFSASSHCVAGAIAGAAASAATNPLDVVKTRLQTQGEVGARRYGGMQDALIRIYQEEGMPGMFRGVRPRVLFHIPAAAVCWTTYEFFKHLMGRPSKQSSD